MNFGLAMMTKRLVHPNEVVREALDQVAMLNGKVSNIGSEMETLRLRITDLSEELAEAKLKGLVAKEAEPAQRGQQTRRQEMGPFFPVFRADIPPVPPVPAALRESMYAEHGSWRTPSERKIGSANQAQAPEEMDRLRARLNSSLDRAWIPVHDRPEFHADIHDQLREIEAFNGEIQGAIDELAQGQGRLLEHVASQAARVHRVESKVSALDDKVESAIISSDPMRSMPVYSLVTNPPEARGKRGRPMFDCGGTREK